MEIYYILGSLLLAIFPYCQGLRCWHCENENSNWECLFNGELQECLSNQKECQNEIRFIAGNRYFKITKRCKQDAGCYNNRKQNQLLVKAYQCEKRDVEDVCWCCCTSDNCNGEHVYCQEVKPKCELLTSPLNGVVSCHRNDGSLGTNCVYRCRPGFKLVGSYRTTCVRTASGAVWSSSAPSCLQHSCEAIPRAPEHGFVSCNDGDMIYSKCQFSCDIDYALIGQSSTVCSHFGTWSDPTPLCVEVTCRLPRRIDHNLAMECTNGNRLGSECRFRCADGYQIRGFTEITCNEPINRGFGRWSRRLPGCEKTACPSRRDAEVANKACTNGNNIGSTCTYSCTEGEYMTSNGEIVRSGVIAITCSAETGWSSAVPICQAISCPNLPRGFSNGDRICSDGNRIGSECTFSCGSGFRIIGSAILRCEQDGLGGKGAWSGPVPRCVAPEPGAGSCENYGDVSNAVVYCTPTVSGNGTHWLPGTVCNLRCGGGFITPIGESNTVRCTSGGWVGQLCCDRCLSTPKLDIIVLMDSSYMDAELWDVSKSFNPNFARYMTEFNDYDELNFIIIPYATTVDTANIVKVSAVTSENYENLATLTESLPFVGAGDSNTGLALKHIGDIILAELVSGSVPLVVILSNRVPNDLKLATSEARRLRDIGVVMRIVPLTDFYTAEPGANQAVFETLTGGEEYSVVESDSVETFYEVASSGINLYPTSCDDKFSACET